MSTTQTRQNLVKITTAARLSGIRVETLRAWDNRDQLKPVQRVGNTRYYTQEQVARMTSLNTLIQSGIGYTIGELCGKTDGEIHALVADLHQSTALPQVLDQPTSSRAVVVGWRLMLLRDKTIEDDVVRTIAPNIEDVESFYDYLRRVDHDGLKTVVVELPSVWDIKFLKDFRERVDQFNQTDCHVIAVSYLNDPVSFESYREQAEAIGMSLLDGSDITWQRIIDEIKNNLALRHEILDPASRVPSSDLSRLARSSQRIAGVAVADLAHLYQTVYDMTGLAQREIAHQPSLDEGVQQVADKLKDVYEELESCLDLIRNLSLNSKDLDQ